MRIFIPIALIIICLLASQLPFIHGQPQGYVLIYSPPRAYTGADWIDVKAVYVKEEGNRLYFYVEYYGAIPSSGDYFRWSGIYMDTDRNPQTGSFSRGLGLDYYIYFDLYGDKSSYGLHLYRWNSTAGSFQNMGSGSLGATLGPGLGFMEVWVDQQAIGYTPKGIGFYMISRSGVRAVPRTELSYVVGSSVKQITVDGEPDDWSTLAPFKTLPSK